MIALPLLILFIMKTGTFPFACFILVLSIVGLLEFYRMALPTSAREGMLFAAVGALYYLVTIFELVPAIIAISILMLIVGLFSLLHIEDIKAAASKAGLLLLGLLYVPLLMSNLVSLRELPFGIQWIFLMLLIVMSGDTAAYYVGSSLGKRKLYPVVSPNKSIEGMFGGLAGSIAGATLAKMTFFPELSAGDAVLAAILVGVLGQLGDLFESLLKRSFGVKDSGAVFPGHGGMLDRLDSILFAAPTLYIYARYIF